MFCCTHNAEINYSKYKIVMLSAEAGLGYAFWIVGACYRQRGKDTCTLKMSTDKAGAPLQYRPRGAPRKLCLVDSQGRFRLRDGDVRPAGH